MENDADARMARILREAREASCRTQEHVAEESGLSVPTISRAERTGRIGDESLRAICSVIGLDAEEVRARAAAAARDVPHERVEIPRSSRYEIARLQPREGRIDFGFALLPPIALALCLGIAGTPWQAAFLLGIVLIAPCFLLFDVLSLCVLPEMAARRRTGSLVFRSAKVATVFLMGFLWACVDPDRLGAIVTIPVFVSMGVGTLLQGIQRQEQKDVIAAAKARFGSEIVPLIAEVRTLVEGNPGPDGMARLRELVTRAAFLAREAGRVDDVAPLVLLEDDVARRVSGRKALMDYLRVAEAALSTDGKSERERQDILRAVDRLEGRLSAYA